MFWALNVSLFHDIVFVVSDDENAKKFGAHKVVLCARSKYFEALLTGGLKVRLPQMLPSIYPLHNLGKNKIGITAARDSSTNDKSRCICNCIGVSVY